jgi:transposase
MMYALDPRVHDPIFETIEHLIPQPAQHPLGCHRRRVSDRLIMRGLLWRLVTGASWETIEVLLDHQVSDTTLRARRDEWIDAGVFVKLLAHAFNGYERLIGINLHTLIIDASNQLAPCGGEGTGMDYKHPGRQGYKWCTAVDTNGAIIGFEIDAANRNDYKMLFPLLDQLAERDLIDNDTRLFADRGFNYPSTRDRLATDYGDHQIVAGVDRPQSTLGAGGAHQFGVAGREGRLADDVVLGDRFGRGLVGEHELLVDGTPGMGSEPFVHPRQVARILDAVERAGALAREQDQFDPGAGLTELSCQEHDRPGDVDERLAVDRIRGIEVNDLADAVGCPVGDAGDHHSPVAVADEHDITQVFVEEQVDDVGDVRVEVDRR